jgi:hypothetical protein
MSDRDRIRKLKDKIERRDRSIQLRNQKIARLEKTIAELEGRLKDAGISRRPPTLTRHRDRRGNEWFSVD